MISHFENLEIYQVAYRLAIATYKLTKQSRNFDLVRETLRSARSIASNIAEGFSRRKEKKILNYRLGVALGEANEMLVHLSFLKDVGDISEQNYEKLRENYEILCRKINTFRQKNSEFIKNPSSKI